MCAPCGPGWARPRRLQQRSSLVLTQRLVKEPSDRAAANNRGAEAMNFTEDIQ